MASRRALTVVRRTPSLAARGASQWNSTIASSAGPQSSSSPIGNLTSSAFQPIPPLGFVTGSRLSIMNKKNNWSYSARFLSSGELPPHQELAMPSLSPTMTQGNIANWRKKEGDQVSPGDVLCEIETDKATLEFEAMEEGFLAKILCGDGSKDIPVGQVIAIIVESGDDVTKFSSYKASDKAPSEDSSKALSKDSSKEKDSPPTPSEDIPEQPESQESKQGPASTIKDRSFASPVARKLAEEENVPLSELKGTGPNGRIVKADVMEHLDHRTPPAKERPSGAPLESLDYKDIPNSQIRRVTAQRLLLSKQTIPHYYLTVDVCTDKLLTTRKQLNEIQEASGGKRVSINDFVLKAAALALRKVPECNSSWTDDYIRQFKNVNISVAVQTDYGLLVPVVKDADKKGLATIADDVKSLAEKAKQNNLKPSDYEGGTFTVSNLGGPFGVKQFCAIINPPQACILAVGSIENRVIPGDRDGEFATGSFMSVTLSCDHRVVDGAIGAHWLGAFKGYIENPMTLLL